MNTKLMRTLRIRGLILEILNAESSGPINTTDLQGRLFLFGFAVLPEDLMPELRYLEGKGYISVNRKYGGALKEISITPKGTDLVQCINGHEDEGVLIPRCEK